MAYIKEYNKLKILVTKKINECKQNYFTNLIENPINKNENLWTHINKFIDKKQKSSLDQEILKAFKFDTPTTLSNKVNLHFSNVVPKLREHYRQRITATKCPSIKTESKLNCKNSIGVFEAEPIMVTNIIKSMKINKSTGMDGVIMSHISESIENSSLFISKLINSIIATEIWPEELKIQVLRPIYKKGSKTDINNYRPIALLSNINKIIEKFFFNNISNFLDKNNILINNQYGFRQQRSTEDAIKHINELISNSLHKGNYIKAVLIDLQKAFDTIDHKKLLKKCHDYGLRGKCHNILKSYLENRKACTKIDNEISDTTDVCFGVPQGSVLGPLLFSIYVNEVSKYTDTCEIILFADDMILLSIHTNKQIMELNLQNDFDKLNRWLLTNDLFISEDKTCCIDISSTHRQFLSGSLFIHTENCQNFTNCNNTCTKIKEVSESKYLGFGIDNHWKHNHHIELLITKLRKMIPLFYKIKNLLNNKNKCIIFDALVTSHLRYGIEVYGFASSSKIERLQRVHNTVLKVLFRKPTCHESTTVLRKKYRILSIDKLRNYTVLLKNYFKAEFKLKDEFKEKFLRDSTIRYKIPLIKNNYGTKIKSYYIPCIFNLIPNNLQNIKSYSKAKKHIKDWLIDN